MDGLFKKSFIHKFFLFSDVFRKSQAKKRLDPKKPPASLPLSSMF
jgi:hypothetical protein